MRTLALTLLFAGFFLGSSPLAAQEELAESRPVLKHRTMTVITAETKEEASRDWKRQEIFASARKHPLTPHDIAMREAVRKLGVNRHRFVRCQLRNGSAVVGGIASIGPEGFSVTQGIWNGKYVPYASLSVAPTQDAAVAEHLGNGLKWTGVVAVCVVVIPVVIVMMPLMFTGVLAD